MKRAAIIVSVLVGVLALAALALLLLPPAGLIAGRLVTAIRDATGRDVSVKGASSVKLGWTLKVHLDDVTIANPAGLAGEPLLVAKSVEVETPTIAALMGRTTTIDAVRLVEPRVTLARDADGRDNWTIATSGSPSLVARLVEIKGGRLSWTDARTKDAASFEAVDGTASDVTGRTVGAFSFTGSKASVDSSGAGASLERPALSGKSVGADGIAELDVKAARLVTRGLGDGIDASLEAPSVHARGVTSANVAALDIAASGLAARLPGGSAVQLDGLDAHASELKSENIGAIALKAKSGRFAGTGGFEVTLADVAAEGRGFTPEDVGSLVVDAGTLGYTLTDGSKGALRTVHAEQRGVTPDSIAELTLKSAALTHSGADGTKVELADITAAAKALSAKSVGEARLEAAQVTATQADARFELKRVEASTKDARLPGPLDLALAFDWNGERVAGTVKLDALALPTADKPLPLAVDVATRNAALALNGTLSAARTIDGKARMSAKSLRELATWLGLPLPKSGPFAAASLDGRISASPTRIEIADAVLALDASKAKGSLVVDISGARPRISGSLSADTFDADAYGLTTPPKPEAVAAALAVAADEPADEAPRPTAKQALKAFARAELLRLEQSAGSGTSAEPSAAAQARKPSPPPPSPWSDAPFDVSALDKADLDLALAVERLRIAGLDVGVPALKAKLDGGILSLDGRDLAVKGGKVTGRVGVEARGGTPRAAANIKADNVEAVDILAALGLSQLVAGKSNIEADLAAGVASQKQLVESVTGSVKVKMGKGAVIGYDPGQILTYVVGGGSYDPRHRWPFSRLDADMSLDKGLSKSTKVSVSTSVAGANSDGTTDLPKRQIDYQARLDVSFWFQPILVRIFGAWNKPQWAADMFDTSRGAATTAADIATLDVKGDPELAALLEEVVAKSPASATPLPAPVLATLRQIAARAATR